MGLGQVFPMILKARGKGFGLGFRVLGLIGFRVYRVHRAYRAYRVYRVLGFLGF